MKESAHNSLCKNSMLIVDEAHELRTGTIQKEEKEEMDELAPETFVNRAHKIIQCARYAKRVLLLTATPYVNHSYDFANLLAMVKGTQAMNINDWTTLMEDEKETLEYFSDSFHYYDVPKTRANQYPDVKIHHQIIEMNNSFYSEYRKVEEDLHVDHMDLGLASTATFLVRFRQALLRIPDSGKVDFTIQHIRKILSRKPDARIVVYSNFIKAGITQISTLLEIEGISHGQVTGSIPARMRQHTIDAYNAGHLRVLLISKAAQRGIDLKQTTCMIILDVPWNPASLDQAIGRVARYQSHTRLPPNQQKVDVYVLYSKKPRIAQRRIREKSEKPSVDILMKEIIDRKREESENFMNLIQHVSIEQ
jgi:superfamily II DNA or RNA helicase